MVYSFAHTIQREEQQEAYPALLLHPKMELNLSTPQTAYYTDHNFQPWPGSNISLGPSPHQKVYCFPKLCEENIHPFVWKRYTIALIKLRISKMKARV